MKVAIFCSIQSSKGGTSSLKSSKVKDESVDKTRHQTSEKGIQYYQFKRRTGAEGPAVAEASAYREVDDTFVRHMELVIPQSGNNLAEWVQEDG